MHLRPLPPLRVPSIDLGGGGGGLPFYPEVQHTWIFPPGSCSITTDQYSYEEEEPGIARILGAQGRFVDIDSFIFYSRDGKFAVDKTGKRSGSGAISDIVARDGTSGETDGICGYMKVSGLGAAIFVGDAAGFPCFYEGAVPPPGVGEQVYEMQYYQFALDCGCSEVEVEGESCGVVTYTEDSPDTVNEESEVILGFTASVADDCGPYRWTISSSNEPAASLVNELTTGLTNEMLVPINACGTITVTITDAVGNSGEHTMRVLENSGWDICWNESANCYSSCIMDVYNGEYWFRMYFTSPVLGSQKLCSTYTTVNCFGEVISWIFEYCSDGREDEQPIEERCCHGVVKKWRCN